MNLPPDAMVDIHAHILPALDDGPASEEVSQAMLRLAFDSGTRSIAATPHANTRFRFDPAAVEEALARLRAVAPPGLSLSSGCDFHLMHDNIMDALDNPTRYTLNGGSYLLVEFSDLVIFGNSGEILSALESAGMRIIVTHPERNPLLRQRPELIEEWVSAGRLMQLTASSLLGQWGPRALAFSRHLLDNGLAHFVASDAHNTTSRPPRLDLARDWLKASYSADLARLLTLDHPAAVLENRPIDLDSFPPPTPAPAKSWLRRLMDRE